MARIGILTCSNATQELGCSSASCLADLRKRKGSFEHYGSEESLDLVGIINCSGCPTLTGPDKLLGRIRALTEFHIDVIHFANCVKALCPFREKYRSVLNDVFPGVEIVVGTHTEQISDDEFRDRVKKLFCQPRKGMPDMILGKD